MVTVTTKDGRTILYELGHDITAGAWCIIVRTSFGAILAILNADNVDRAEYSHGTGED